MKVSLANLMKTQVEKMSDSIPEQKLMKTSEFHGSEQMFMITNGLILFPGSSLEQQVARDSRLWTPGFGGLSVARPAYTIQAWCETRTRPKHGVRTKNMFSTRAGPML